MQRRFSSALLLRLNGTGAHVISGMRASTSTPGKVKVVVTDKDGSVSTSQYDEGLNLMEAIRDDPKSPVDMQGICGGMCKCSTCHVYVDPQWLPAVNKKFPVTDFESDILDVALEVTPESRLCCQIVLDTELEGLKVTIPKQTRDMRFRRPGS